MSAPSPYEENILDFVELTNKQPNLLKPEDRAALGDLLANLPDDDIQQLSDELALWCEARPHIYDALLDIPVEESASHRGPGGRKTSLTPKEYKELLENVVRQSPPPAQSQTSPPKP